MAAVKSLIGLALAGSIGMTLLILASTWNGQNWWPAIVTIFYFLVPFPILIARNLSGEEVGFGGQSNPPKEWAYFLTVGVIISAIALPIEMARVGTIATSAAVLSIGSSIFFFSTILAFFIVFQSDDSYSSGLF